MPPVSINKSQANLLVTAWLDNIGQSKTSLAETKLSHVEETLYTLAAQFKLMAEENLSVQDAINTGQLADSIQWTKVKFAGGVYEVDIKILDYWKFIDKGVRGTEGGSGEFAFKHNRPSKKMMEQIRKWMIREGLKVRVKPARNNPIGQERKGAAFKGSDKTTALAYAVATSIKKKGIKPTGFFTQAAEGLESELAKSAADTFKIAIINELIS